MPRALLVPIVAAVVALSGAVARPAFGQTRAPTSAHGDDLARARALDQQGARAYGDGHYNDAIRYFEESLRLGGPPFELWNIAKCYVKLDQPAAAADVLERYLATPNLPTEDRDEASQQLEVLRRRPSTVTLGSSPSGATVLLDGHAVEGSAFTPTSFVVPPGAHTVTLSAARHAAVSTAFDARYGRAIILDVRLVPDAKEVKKEAPAAPLAPLREGELPLTVRGFAGLMVPRYGGVGGSPQPTAVLSGSYEFARAGHTGFSAGALLSVTADSWDNTVAASNTVSPCGSLRDSRSATAFAAFATGGSSWNLTPELRVDALFGVGVAAISANDLGGDLFIPACHPSPGARPALLLGARVDYAVSRLVRLSALPLALQIQPSFDGTRATPVDASGIWLRATIAVGVGVDL